jgi:hypothetical protein
MSSMVRPHVPAPGQGPVHGVDDHGSEEEGQDQARVGPGNGDEGGHGQEVEGDPAGREQVDEVRAQAVRARGHGSRAAW